MLDKNIQYAFEHWIEMRPMGEYISANMKEVPAGVVTIGSKDFYVGGFKIARSLVTEYSWKKVMGIAARHSRKPITSVSFLEISDYLERLRIPWKGAGYLTIPTEAQLELARSNGFIKASRMYKEICLTQFKNTDEMGNHHFFDNLPKEEPYDLVARRGEERFFIPFDQKNEETGFRLVLVDYNHEKNDDELLSLLMNL